MPGLFETGGSIDSLFDVVRGELGKADTEIQGFLHDRLRLDSDRAAVQKVLWSYAQGIKDGSYTAFTGSSDPNVPKILAYVKNRAAFDDTFIYNVIFALSECAKTDMACASVLAGSDGNIFDSLENGGVISTVTGAVNDTLKGLGFPSLANTVIILGLLGIVGVVIYLKVRK
jgi:hypothetical protein